jgi:MCP family monocarboxylic acid transporter-like MFS transporter 10
MIPVFSLGSTGDIGRRTGMVLTFAAIGGLAGTPIAGAINKASGGYKAVGYYAGMPPVQHFLVGDMLTVIYIGAVTLLAVILSLITRHLVLGKLRGRF